MFEEKPGTKMKITKRQLRKIIREEKASLLEDDKYAQLPKTDHERVTGAQSEFVEDNWLPWLDERGLGAEDLDDLARFTGAPDRSWLPAVPPADGMDGPADLELWARNRKAEIKESTMKITKRQLRRIIKEEKARIIAEQRDDRAFLQAMETIMGQLMVMDPASRVQNAETLIQNLETVIDQAKQG